MKNVAWQHSVIYVQQENVCTKNSRISTRHAVGPYWFPGHTGVRTEIADKLTRDGSGQWFVGPEPFLGVSRQNISQKIKR
jgi:hypothetical protein